MTKTRWSWAGGFALAAMVGAGLFIGPSLAGADGADGAQGADGAGQSDTGRAQMRRTTTSTTVRREIPHGKRSQAVADCADFLVGYSRSHPSFTRAEIVAANRQCARAYSRDAG